MHKILVVGGTGFIGLHLIQNLLNEGFKVASISKKKRKIKNRAKFFFLDLSKKIDQNLINKIQADTIVYAASLNNIDAEKNFLNGYKIGHLSLVNLLNSNNIKKRLKKIIFLSTAQVYQYYTRKNINLESKVYPKTAYSLFHILTENYLKYFSLKYKIKTTCLRISNGYGEPYLDKTNCWSIAVNSFCLQAFKDKIIKINTNPYEYRNFIYVKDISNEITLNIKKKQKEYFLIKNIGSNQNYTLKNVAKIIKEIFKSFLKTNIKIVYNKKKQRKIKIFKYENNNMLRTKDLTNLRMGIFNLIKFIKINNGKV
tara:strand:- start:1732 stop:2667 length:936 start_codon:yes stop_codon:yes gene_type:complete